MSTFTELNRLYIKKGLKIFPVIQNGKQPLIENWQNDCSCDVQQISYWIENAKDCNWGMPCTPNNLFVMDVDMHETNGIESLKRLLHDLGIDSINETLLQGTPSGGLHLIFKSDDDLKKVSNSSNSFPSYPGIDIRTDGYICVYPSKKGDKCYKFYDENQSISEMPEQLKNFILSQKELLKDDKDITHDVYVLPNKVEKGNRDTELFNYISHLYFATRLSREEIYVLATYFNENICEPSLPKRTIDYKIDKAFKKNRSKCICIYIGDKNEIKDE